MTRPTTTTADSLLTISYGVGRDSTAVLCLLADGALEIDGEIVKPTDVDAIIFADTGDEWDHTYQLLPRARAFCKSIGVPFYVLAKPPRTGPHGWERHLRTRKKGDRTTPPWRTVIPEDASLKVKARRGYYANRAPLLEDFASKDTIPARRDASCTFNHKVLAIRRMINDLATAKFGVGNRSWWRTGRPRHRVVMGIAADEAHRAIDTGRPSYERPVYPLVDMGIDKDDEQAILEDHGFGDVRKSGCRSCPMQSVGWFWSLSVIDPDHFATIVAAEAAALARNPKMFLVGKAPLEVNVAAWRARHPDADVNAVLDKSYCWACPKRKAQGEQLSLIPAAAK